MKIYVLKQGNVILGLSKNLKALYDFLVLNIPDADKQNLKGYVQFWRDFKKQNKITIPCRYSEYYEMVIFHTIKNIKKMK